MTSTSIRFIESQSTSKPFKKTMFINGRSDF